MKSFIFACEGHDEAFGNHMLRSYLCSENRFSRSNSVTLLASASENLLTKGGTQIVLLSIENFSFMSHLLS